jgi:hypothetical protein
MPDDEAVAARTTWFLVCLDFKPVPHSEPLS